MKKRYSEEQIVGAMREAESGIPAKDICRKMGVSEPTFYAWRKKYKGMEIMDVRKLRTLEVENAKLKRLVADLSLDVVMLKDVNSRKW